MTTAENAIIDDSDLNEAIHHSPGLIASLWVVTTADDLKKPLFVSLNSIDANSEIQRLSNETPGVEFVSFPCTAKLATEIVKVPLEFVPAGCLSNPQE